MATSYSTTSSSPSSLLGCVANGGLTRIGLNSAADSGFFARFLSAFFLAAPPSPSAGGGWAAPGAGLDAAALAARSRAMVVRAPERSKATLREAMKRSRRRLPRPSWELVRMLGGGVGEVMAVHSCLRKTSALSSGRSEPRLRLSAWQQGQQSNERALSTHASG